MAAVCSFDFNQAWLQTHGVRWLDMLLAERGLSAHTVDAYRQDLRALGEFCEKSGICSARPENGGAADDASVPALDEQSLLLFVVWLRRRGDGHRTLARRLSSLRGFLGWCAEEKLIRGNPAALLDGPKLPQMLPNVLSVDEVRALLKKHGLTLAGVNQHIGSLFMEPDNYLNAIEFLLHFIQSDLADLFPGIEIIDFGGGLGIPYRKYEEEPRLDMQELGRRLHALLSAWVGETGYKGKFFIEPGRYVVAECGVLLGTVHATKFNGENRYVGTDLGFNVLVRPAMYDSFHDIEIFRDGGEPDAEIVEQSIVGNICESGDILAKKRMLPLIKEGDIVAALDAGAYGFVMSSSYNQRPRAAEVLITSDGTPKLIRRRETLDDLTRCFVEE